MIAQLYFFGKAFFASKKGSLTAIQGVLLALIFLIILIALIVFFDNKSNDAIDAAPKLFEGFS